MIDGIEFSERGSAPTPFEQRLLATIGENTATGLLGWRLVQQLGPEAGATALAIVLDEIGGGLRFVPQRREFFQRLWRQERDRLIVDLATRGDWTDSAIGGMFGISRQRVARIRGRALQPPCIDAHHGRPVNPRP